MFGEGHKSFVFGPCSVESQEQVDAVAADLQAKGEKFIRGGHLNLVHHHTISKV